MEAYPSIPINGFRRLLSGKTASLTGSTAESAALATISLPPPGKNGGIRLTLIVKCSGVAGTKTVRAKFDGTSLAFEQSTSANLSGYFQRTLFADNSETAQFSETNGALGPSSWSSNAIQTFTKDWTSAKDLTITGQLANSADSIDWVYYLVEHMRAN